MYVKDESDDVQNTVDVTLVNDDDKQIEARKRIDLFYDLFASAISSGKCRGIESLDFFSFIFLPLSISD